MKPKVLYIISDIEKALAFEWIAEHLSRDKMDLKFIVIGRDNTPLVNFLRQKNVLLSVIPFSGKSDLIKAWKVLFMIIRKYKPEVVHTHLYYANILGLTSAWLLRVPKRIYTRHHASIHHLYFKRAVFIDKMINRLATDIVVLSSPLKEIVVNWERTSEVKVHLIPHGFNMKYFQCSEPSKIENIRNKYSIHGNAFIIGVISRYTAWKGIQYIIQAFRTVVQRHPHAHLLLANAQGDYALQIKQMLNELSHDQYTEIVFEQDVASLYHLFNIYVHTPEDEYCEAFGQTYVESLAAGIPAVFSLSGIACDFIEHEKNALVVPYRDAGSIAHAVLRLMDDKHLCARVTEYGRISVEQRFSLQQMLLRLEQLYVH